jgi:hypothetical protein
LTVPICKTKKEYLNTLLQGGAARGRQEIVREKPHLLVVVALFVETVAINLVKEKVGIKQQTTDNSK